MVVVVVVVMKLETRNFFPVNFFPRRGNLRSFFSECINRVQPPTHSFTYSFSSSIDAAAGFKCQSRELEKSSSVQAKIVRCIDDRRQTEKQSISVRQTAETINTQRQRKKTKGRRR